MPNPSADFPTAVHTATDISGYGSQALGATVKQTTIIGKVLQEIVAIEEKLGVGASEAADAVAGAKLVKRGANTVWEGASRAGTITRDADGYIATAVLDDRTITITRASGLISSFTDGTNTWTFTRDANSRIVSWAVT